jgi:hypothetical protein
MRKQKKYHYIYKTTNLLSGKYYIGMHSTDNLEDGYLGSGTRLRRSINKYGKDNFKREILYYTDTREELKALEQDVITLNEIAKVDCMNLKVGGEGGFISDKQQKHRSECANKALRERRKNDENFNRDWLIKVKMGVQKAMDNGKMANIKDNYDWNGKTHSEETKRKLSEIMKTKGHSSSNSQYGKCWITNEIENKKIYQGDVIPSGWRLGRKMK